MKQLFYLIALLIVQNTIAQDTIRVMYYNILNYPEDSPERVAYLRTIMQYAKPDVLVVNELLSNEGATLILEQGLNVWGETKFQKATFINGPDTDNMLYYNADKLGLIAQVQIPTGLRDISGYKLYYKAPSLTAISDTILLNFYSLHLKAGSGFFAQRKAEVQALKFHLNAQGTIENVFAGGDFNFYSGNESGCIALRELGAVDLFDPIDQIGNWNNNSAYANIHTQSTRTFEVGGGSGGGMDDRFDLIFTSLDVLNNENGLRMINNSYQALGQDGSRFNQRIDIPYNATVPDSVVDALYFMSDHLPVMLDVLTDYTSTISEVNQKSNSMIFYNNEEQKFVWDNFTAQSGELKIYDLRGNCIETSMFNTESIRLKKRLKNGLYIYQLWTDKIPVATGKFVVN